MGYAQLNRSRFSYDVFLRGEDYEQMGNVSIESFTPTQVTAIVDGTYPYEVRVEFSKDQHILRHHCTCPYHAKGKCCKHIAAVLFAIDSQADALLQKKYPLEDDDQPKCKFQNASGWAITEFQQKSVEVFQSLMESSKEEFLRETQYFFRASFSQYGYKKQRECADTFYKVLLAMERNVEKKTLFIHSLLECVESMSIISIFFAKAVYNIKNRVFINKLLSEEIRIVEDYLNGDFVAAMNPMNVFSVLDENVLTIFGSYYYFSFESDEQMFIDACEACGAFDALSALLKRTRMGSDPATKRILSILNKDATALDSFVALLDSYVSASIGFLELFEAFLKLEESERVKIQSNVLDATRWNAEHYTAITIAIGEHFNSGEVQHLSLPCLMLLADKIEEKGDDFVDRSIPKRIQKEIKYFNAHYSGDGGYVAILDSIKRFSKYPLVVNVLRDDTMNRMSLSNAAMRKYYLQTLDGLGLLKANDIYPFHEVGLCF